MSAQLWLKMTTEQHAIVHAFDNAKLDASSDIVDDRIFCVDGLGI